MRDSAESLLLAHGADAVEHPGGTLLEHLRRVESILTQWDASNTVRTAGLCHAFYGTGGFQEALLRIDERHILEKAIGPEAESLVYLYCSCDRDFVYPQLGRTRVDFRDRFTNVVFSPEEHTIRAFVEITAANELDVVRHNRQIAAVHGRGLSQLFERAQKRLSPAAVEAWRNEAIDDGS